MVESILDVLLGSLLILAALGLILYLLIALQRRRRLDRCLQAFEDYFVTVERRSGKRWSGVMRLAESGFELARPAAAGETGQSEAAYLHYAAEYDDIALIWRDVDELSARERSRRHQSLEVYAAGGSRRRQRYLDSLLDDLGDLFTRLAGRPPRLQTPAPPPGASPAARLHPIIGYAGNRHDPLLERSLGQRVVCHLVFEEALYERVGELADYSPRFLLLLDVPFPQLARVRIVAGEGGRREAGMQVEKQGNHVEITNLTAYPLLLDTLRMGDKVKELGIVLEAKQRLGLNLEAQSDSETCEIRCQSVRKLDLIVPRSRAVVRYRAETPADFGLFDIGITLRAPEEEGEREERLRWELRQHPHNAAAAASLARLLYRRGALQEAEDLFRQALAHPRALADGGQRVANELEQLRRRQNQQGDEPA